MSTMQRHPALDGMDVVAQPSPGAPLVTVRLVLRAGSAWDPPGLEGLAALTARMVGDAGTTRRSYRELTEALYPLGTSLSVRCDRELVSIVGTVHVDRLDAFTDLLLEAVLTPGFDEGDLERARQAQLSHLLAVLRSGSDEQLGLEVLQQSVFGPAHPYGHAPEGTVRSLRRIGVHDVRRFHATAWSRARLMVGVAGGYGDAWLARLMDGLRTLPPGVPSPAVPEPIAPTGRHALLVQKATGSVGLHLGHPLAVDRAHPDFPALWLANSFLGEHRTFHGRLMQQLRGLRGLNYGDYSYMEHYASPTHTLQPSPSALRTRPHFSVWLRPVAPDKALFAMRAALHELDRLIVRGMSQPELESTREFLLSYARLWTQTASRRLGFAMDGWMFGVPGLVELLADRLPALRAGDVTEALRRHIHTDRWRAVLVCGDAARLTAELRADVDSPISYPASVPDEVMETDRLISARRLSLTEIESVRAEDLFEGE